MIIDKFGNNIYDSTDLLNLMYIDQTYLTDVLVHDNDEILNFEKNTDLVLNKYDEKINELSIEEFDLICQSNWLIPENYKTIDIEGYLLEICPKENTNRLQEELTEYKSKNLLMLLKALKYLVDTMRENNILWGVGRGSSVSSYALYLLGIHKIDSVKHNLDWREFLR